jgi:hypothetical protein
MITLRGMAERFLFGVAILAAPFLTVCAFGADPPAEFYSSFMPMTCCFTNSCCYPIEPHEVVDLGDGYYRVVASGQVVRRSGFSPDGRYHRCACDEIGRGRWRVHPQANTRCLYVPHNSS